jgi:hypothetical protein
VNHALFALLAFVLLPPIFAESPAPEVILISPCECQGFHGKNRWIVKTDFTPVPLHKSAIQSVTPSQMHAWEELGADVDLTPYSEARMPSEEKRYALTGRVLKQKWKQTATFTSRSKMPPETTSERLAPGFRWPKMV